MHVMTETRLRIGEVAEATGVTVRTLRHYDALGLLVPSERTSSGYRLYAEADLRRLYRILALRRVGFGLDDIAAALEADGDDPRPALRRHLAQLDEQVRLAETLRARLTRILDVLDRAEEPSGAMFIEAIEGMTTMERYYTLEQLEQLEQRRQALGPEAIERVQQEWADLYAELERHRAAGVDPGAPEVQALARRSSELIEMFTGGDPGIRASLQRMYDEQGPERASRGMAKPELVEYLQRAHAARG
ncbi:MAG TPA: MerR family transcriptional regulator [Solirubrobacteraceae bacterium]|nr:MerR family transcriptional regulator [Solirubrobacteraceae bacterium]